MLFFVVTLTGNYIHFTRRPRDLMRRHGATWPIYKVGSKISKTLIPYLASLFGWRGREGGEDDTYELYAYMYGKLGEGEIAPFGPNIYTN